MSIKKILKYFNFRRGYVEALIHSRQMAVLSKPDAENFHLPKLYIIFPVGFIISF